MSIFDATRDGNLDLLRNLLRDEELNSREEHFKDTILHVACKMGHHDIVRFLLTRDDCDTSLTNELGQTALHVRSYNGFLKNYHFCQEACAKGYLEIVKPLIQNKVKIHARNSVGVSPLILFLSLFLSLCHFQETPLHLASDSGHFDVVAYLLNHFCKIKTKSIIGYTPLHSACLHRHLKIVKILIIARSNISARDKWHNTPLHIACYNNDVDTVRYLLWKNANPRHINSSEKTCEMQTNNIDVKDLLKEYEMDRQVYKLKYEKLFVEEEIQFRRLLRRRKKNLLLDEEEEDDGVVDIGNIDMKISGNISNPIAQEKLGMMGKCQTVFWILLCLAIIIAVIVIVVLLVVFFL